MPRIPSPSVPLLLASVIPHAVARAAVVVVPSPAAPDLATAVTIAEDGDEIRVAPRHAPTGERVRVTRSVTIAGDQGVAALPPLEVARNAVVSLVDVRIAATSGDADACPAAVCVAGATLMGEGVAIEGGVAVNEGTLVVSDGAWTGDGVGIRAVAATVTLTRPTFTGLSGGAIRGEGAAVVILNGQFVGNDGPEPGVDVHLDGGALTVVETGFSGGADSAIAAQDATVALTDVSFDGYTAATGAALQVRASAPLPVVVDGLVATDLWAEDAGGLAWLDGVDAVLAGIDAADVSAGLRGGVVATLGGRVEWVMSSVVAGGVGLGDGGVVWAAEGELVLDDVTVVGDGSIWAARGGVVAAVDADVTIVDSAASGLGAQTGGFVHGTGTLAVDGLSVADVSAETRGGVIAWRDGGVDLSGVEALRPSAWRGALAELVDVGALRLRTSRVVDGAAPGGGIVRVVGRADGSVRNTRFCGGVTAAAGSGLVLDGFAAGMLAVENNVFLGNASVGGGPVVASRDGLPNSAERLVIRNNVFAGNTAPGGAIRIDGVAFELVNNVILGSELGLAVAAPGRDAGGGFNLWHGNAVDTTAPGFPAATALTGPPGFVGYTPGDCEARLYLRADSPLRDAGDPTIRDPDGSRSDVGAYGGPHARIPDADGDGVGADLDCDDTRADRAPGAIDVPYDGVDQDCDGEDLCDVDGDGALALECEGGDCDDDDPATRPGAVDSPYDGVDQDCDGRDVTDADGDGWVAGVAGGADCDDGDPTVYPGADEITGDGIDQDCSGGDRRAFLAGGGGCRTVPGRGAAWWALGLLAGAARRRSGAR